MKSPAEFNTSPKQSQKSLKHFRETLFLAEQVAEGKLKILPSKNWSLHYPVDQATRLEKIRGLAEGKHTAEEVGDYLKPDALFYNIEDLEKEGLEAVSGRIRDLVSYITHYDYSKFAKFVESMADCEVSLEELDRLYSDIVQARIQKKTTDSYGYTGRKQMAKALQTEADRIIENMAGFSRSQKVLKALKLNWLAEDLGVVSMEERDRAVSELSGDERELFEKLQSYYREYIKTGNEGDYQTLVDSIREGLPKIQKKAKEGEISDSMQELEEELEPYLEQVVPPGSPEDPAIPPEDQDEYHTPPPAPGESKEKAQERAMFEIKPPLGGSYASGRRSFFDIDSKTWSKKKQLFPYNNSPTGANRYTISGTLDKGLKSLPLPNGYALDASSLKTQGLQIEIKRDQNACFYFEVNGTGSFSIDFLQEQPAFIAAIIPEDTAPLARGLLSAKTEALNSRLIGTNLQKAEQARQYILANHFYPGGGDLQKAQALQYKLRNESTGDDYLQNVDMSEYLECYSANTLFIAIMRRAGIPARLVTGHKVEGAKDGKSIISQNTGHAWSEIWDGQAWRRFDATPDPKPEDQKQSDNDNQDSKKDPAEEADDGGVDRPQQKQNGQDQKGDQQKQNQNQKTSDSSNPLEQMADASDSQLQESESQLQEVKDQIQEMMEEKDQLGNKLQDAENFKELSELQKEIEESELIDELKKELQEKLDAIEDLMKDQIKDELDKMLEDGFIDQEERDKIIEELEQKQLEELDQVQKRMEQENKLYNEYEHICEEILPLVDEWFKYFAERLPRQEDLAFDEDSLTRQGAFNRRATMRIRNLMFGTVKNPRIIVPSIKPRFMASILVDVSGSMSGEKLQSARKLLIFYSELFSRISQEFGYIHFSIDTFSDSVTEIKGFKQDYDSPQNYDFADGTKSTVKVRLMQQLSTQGGTNMLDGIKKVANELNKLVEEYPDYASAFYFIGDGGDTCGNAANIRRFLEINESERGFGEHMYSAILLGNESQRKELAEIFGDEHTDVAPNFDDLIEKSMDKFDNDLEEYLRYKIQ
jgi:uncharacterized protein YegL